MGVVGVRLKFIDELVSLASVLVSSLSLVFSSELFSASAASMDFLCIPDGKRKKFVNFKDLYLNFHLPTQPLSNNKNRIEQNFVDQLKCIFSTQHKNSKLTDT